jgi:hypothetical protein
MTAGSAEMHRHILRFAAVIALLAGVAGPLAAQPLHRAPADAAVVPADWQGPRSLPPRFRNHCRFDPVGGAALCSNHCGIDFQFYYCSQGSFGCCRPGAGFCGWDGRLRCAP